MKKIYLFIVLLFCSINYANAGINPQITITGNSTQVSPYGYGEILVLPNDANGVKINASALDDNANADISILGKFWLKGLSSTTDASLGWVSFDNIGTATHVILKNITGNQFRFEGYAWSHAAGWIYFGDTGISNGQVIYNRSTGKINGCGFSQNIGWVCFDNISLDTTAPSINGVTSTIFEANHNKTVSLSEPSQIKVENYASAAKSTYATGTSFTHDFRAAKNYSFILTDTSGNTIDDGKFIVVAGTPTNTIDTQHKILSNSKASEFTSTLLESRIANNDDKHNINFTLRDKYGNTIVPVTGIKDVSVKISLSNTVDNNQISNINLGDAINYNGLGLINGYSNIGTFQSTNGNYNLDISSYAPTKAGYVSTTDDNDISISNIKVSVTGLYGYTGVGELEVNDFFLGDHKKEKFKFTPTVSVASISNDLSWKMLRDVKTYFTGTIALSDTKNITNLKVQSFLDTLSGSTTQNNLISFQDVNGTNFVTDCKGYNLTTGYYSSNSNCNNLDHMDSSYIKKSFAGTYNSTTTLSDGFYATPMVVLPGVQNFGVKYSSNIYYKQDNNEISYPSLTVEYGDSLVNNQIKVAGLVNQNSNSFGVISNQSLNYVGNLDKSQIFKNIYQNVQPYKLSGQSVGRVYYSKNNITITDSILSNYDTIIADGADVIIADDIIQDTNIKTIIALKNSSGTNGKIWITKNVKNITAILVTDRSVLSGDGSNNYSENVAKNQLYIKGSIISYNTIGGSSSTPTKCPFYISSCTYDEAKKYDFNNFRYYYKGIIDGNPALNATKTGYDAAPLIVEYDSRVQLNPPSILKIN